MTVAPKDDEPSEPPTAATPSHNAPTSIGATGDGARERAAWRTWLSAMASDAEAVMAAALAYEALTDEGRDAWLDALTDDAPHVDVPVVALYAPLLAVEADEGRRARIVDALATAQAPPNTGTRFGARALRGTIGDSYACIVLSPLYLDFVELLVCRYHPARGIEIAQHEPLCHREQVEQRACALLGEVPFSAALLPDVVEELAHAVVADRRDGREAPDALARFTHLFAPDVDKLQRRG
jgi:hypothetical protein